MLIRNLFIKGYKKNRTHLIRTKVVKIYIITILFVLDDNFGRDHRLDDNQSILIEEIDESLGQSI